jgi:hypothetical protein
VPQERENEKSKTPVNHLFRARRVLGDGLGAFRHGVLGELTGQDETDGCLDLAGRDGGLLVVGSELGGLGSDALEDV